MISKWLCGILLLLLLPIRVAAQETNLVAYAGFQAPRPNAGKAFIDFFSKKKA